jgi:hypothetical protein
LLLLGGGGVRVDEDADAAVRHNDGKKQARNARE